MRTQTTAAIVDVYDSNGSFVTRVDFKGNNAETFARDYANALGDIIASGTSVLLDDLRTPSLTFGHFSTFIPDGAELNLDRASASGTVSSNVAKTLKVFVVRKPVVPKRSPLHNKALTADELTFGMMIQPYHDGRPFGRPGVVLDKPFLKTDDCLGSPTWKVKVATYDYKDDSVVEEWYLSDRGMVPYTSGNGQSWWNEKNFTLQA